MDFKKKKKKLKSVLDRRGVSMSSSPSPGGALADSFPFITFTKIK